MKTNPIHIKQLVLALCCLLSSEAYSQAQQTYSLDECIKMALEKNVLVKNSQLDVLSSEHRMKEVKSSLMPTSELNAQYLYYMQTPSQYAPASTFGGPEGEYTKLNMYMPQTVSAGMLLTQNLYNQSVFSGIRAASASREVSQLQVAVTQESTVYNVTATYYTIQVLNDNLVRLAENIANLEKSVKINESLKENELISENTHNRLLINLENLRNQYENQKIIQQKNITLLKYLMDMDMSAPLEVETFDYTEVLEEPGTSEITQRPDIQLQQAQVKLSEYDKKSTAAKFYPVLVGNLSMAFTSYNDEFAPTEQIENDWINSQYFSLSLKIPVFDGFQKQSQVRQKKVAVEKNNNTLALMKLNAQKEIEDASNDYSANKNLVAINKKNLDLAQELFNTVQSEYANDLTSLTELINAQNDLTSALTNYSTALLNLKLAELSVKKANGTLIVNQTEN